MKSRFFELAKKTSLKSRYKFKIGTIIVRKGKVISLGFNDNRTHPKSPTPYHQLHAELSAILNSGLKDFKDCEIYNYRETPTGKIAPSKPCIYCQKMLNSLNIKSVYYTDYEGYKKL